MNENSLNELLRQPGIWRLSDQSAATSLAHAASGFAELDRALPGGGWPLGALTEILHDQDGIGELRLLMPALARLSRQGRWIALIAPPHIPYAPALAAAGFDLSKLLLIHPKTATAGLWALEQALRGGTCGAVLAWPRRIDERNLRRLQLAAEAGSCWGVLFRDRASGMHSSPAALRLELERNAGETILHLLKCRGGQAGLKLALNLDRKRAPKRSSTAAPSTVLPLPRRAARAGRRPPLSRARPLPQLELPLSPSEPAGNTGTAPTWLRRK